MVLCSVVNIYEGCWGTYCSWNRLPSCTVSNPEHHSMQHWV